MTDTPEKDPPGSPQGADPPDTDALRHQARKLYEAGTLSIAETCGTLKISRSRLYRWVKAGNWKRRYDEPRRAGAKVEAGDQERRIAALYRAYEREVEEIERRFAEPSTTRTTGKADDASARKIAALVQTLAKLNELDAATKSASGSDDASGDIEGLRKELARRLARMRRAGTE
ncbi:hypothetical protein GGD81_002826 [Rhodobium orientis]|uniref:Helix-turn-helix domain-containing protein n=1 Tax=Rhodobium orientis TaxID=34017 RepID=A0A327JMI5_9HYPH|nr:hypothetical protein [Rhodobium orientis]MBB4303774.1 hypothetical protein [Rhodobium orientis]MBK5947894.1 hypothetical protein [Rhodobium orientis]RAI26062.1 hypothetical protein CH339_15465 [Rhodobium orientis]